MFNGKPRFNIEVAVGTNKAEVERLALTDKAAEKWIAGKTPKKVIVVPNKIVNVVVKSTTPHNPPKAQPHQRPGFCFYK